VYRLVSLVMALLLPVGIYAGASESSLGESAKTVASHNSESYRLAAGDSIRIQVFGEDDLNLEVRLDSSGVINYPFLGKLLSIVEHRSFFIEGEVKNPGAYPYQPGLTVRKAISLAGGFTDFAARDHFKLLHDKDSARQSITVGYGARVTPGDSISVAKSIFYIDGEVKKPGSYPYHLGLTLREAISLAGGLTERASDSNIQIVSKDGSEHVIGRAGMGTKIVSGDSIYIKQSFF